VGRSFLVIGEGYCGVVFSIGVVPILQHLEMGHGPQEDGRAIGHGNFSRLFFARAISGYRGH